MAPGLDISANAFSKAISNSSSVMPAKGFFCCPSGIDFLSGRVFLNLFNNAFQALSAVALEKEGHASKVIVTTRNLRDKVEITIGDNGPGIPDDIKDKIFQPFFTTKPTGQGTGLGLSLSYDIIKAHGGEINMTSSKDLGTTFLIILPNQNNHE